MIDEIRQGLLSIKSGGKQLREFALVVGGVLLLIGAVLLYKGRTESGWWLCAIGGTVVVSGSVAPRLLLPFQKVWMALSVVIGAVMSRLVLAAIFYLVITPIGLVARLSGKRFLERGADGCATTYWNQRKDPRPAGRDELDRQF